MRVSGNILCRILRAPIIALCPPGHDKNKFIRTIMPHKTKDIVNTGPEERIAPLELPHWQAIPEKTK